jgi:hypothetical protein
LIHRGCHCLSAQFPPSHQLYHFDPALWDQTVRAVGRFS